MKKRIDLLILPIVAFAAVAGTGFGAWYFVTNNTTAVGAANFEITAAKSVGDFTVATSGKIILDQMADMTAANGANQPTLTITNGDVSATGSYDGTGSNSGTSYSYTYSNGNALDTKVYYDISCTIGGGLQTYVSLSGITGTTESYKVTIDGSNTSVTLYPQFDWKDASKPVTKAQYDTMVSACQNGTIVFNVAINSQTNPNNA